MEVLETGISKADALILRGLGQRLREIADDPVNQERRRLWYKHDALQGERPMVLAELDGVLDEVFPEDAMGLECTNRWARGIEHNLRFRIFRFERLADDWVVEPWINVPWDVTTSSYGAEAGRARRSGWSPGGTDPT